MRTPLVTELGHHEHPPQPPESSTTESQTDETDDLRRVRRIGFLDRAALHLGVALIRWGRRPVRKPRRVRPTLSPEDHQAQLQAEAIREEYRSMYVNYWR